MEQNSFENVARALASGMPRRTLLRRLGAGMVGAITASFFHRQASANTLVDGLLGVPERLPFPPNPRINNVLINGVFVRPPLPEINRQPLPPFVRPCLEGAQVNGTCINGVFIPYP